MAAWSVRCRGLAVAVFALVGAVASAAGTVACATRRTAGGDRSAADGDERDVEPWLVRRTHPSALKTHGPAPGPATPPPLLPGMERVWYRSAARGVELSLAAVVVAPRRAPETGVTAGERQPAVLLLHPGSALTEEHLAWAAPFLAAGVVVLFPTWRGEHGNAGELELLAGEVDDVKAAARWLATQPDVDVDRLSVFGHAEGGALAALLALDPDVPFAYIAAANGVTTATTFARWQREEARRVPFDAQDAVEQRLRALLPNAGELARPLVLYLGEDDAEGARDAQRVQERAPVRVDVVTVAGAGDAVAPAALQRFLALVTSNGDRPGTGAAPVTVTWRPAGASRSAP